MCIVDKMYAPCYYIDDKTNINFFSSSRNSNLNRNSLGNKRQRIIDLRKGRVGLKENEGVTKDRLNIVDLI